MRYIHSNNKTWQHLKPYAQYNRQNQTEAEKIVWQAIRAKKLGVRFRRQHVMHEYIVDFVSIEKNLVVEIDGDSHENSQEYDNIRTKVLNDMGFKVIRFTNDEVRKDLSNVIDIIEKNLGD